MQEDHDYKWLEAKVQRLEGRMQNIDLNIRYYRQILARLTNQSTVKLQQHKTTVKLQQMTMFGT